MNVNSDFISEKHKRKGCRPLILSALAFIILVYGIIVACMTIPDKDKARENSLKQIKSCSESYNDKHEGDIQKYYNEEACNEMKKQHDTRFK